ncbi:hypothetical protein FKM82_022218 [Ascaphus truei]
MYKEVTCSSPEYCRKTRYMSQWEEDLGEVLEQEEWGEIFVSVAKSSIGTTLRENAYNENLSQVTPHCVQNNVERRQTCYICCGPALRLPHIGKKSEIGYRGSWASPFH